MLRILFSVLTIVLTVTAEASEPTSIKYEWKNSGQCYSVREYADGSKLHNLVETHLCFYYPVNGQCYSRVTNQPVPQQLCPGIGYFARNERGQCVNTQTNAIINNQIYCSYPNYYGYPGFAPYGGHCWGEYKMRNPEKPDEFIEGTCIGYNCVGFKLINVTTGMEEVCR